jgi:hypothetical protein
MKTKLLGLVAILPSLLGLSPAAPTKATPPIQGPAPSQRRSQVGDSWGWVPNPPPAPLTHHGPP